MYITWIKPLIWLLKLFGIIPFFFLVDPGAGSGAGAAGGEGNPGGDDDEGEDEDDDVIEITDDTDLLSIDNQDVLDEVMERDDFDIDKYLDLVSNLQNVPEADRKILLKDVKLEAGEPIKPSTEKKQDDDDDETGKDEAAAAAAAAAAKDKEQKPPAPAASEQKPAGQKPGLEGKGFTVTEDFIKKAVDDFKTEIKDKDAATQTQMLTDYEGILRGIKGRTTDAQMLKNYVNAQTYIKTIKTPFSDSWKPDEKVVKDPDYIAKATTQKNLMITQAIQRKYPDFPDDGLTDKEARSEFVKNLVQTDPEAYDDYKKIITETENYVNTTFDKWYHVVTNWKSMARDTVAADVKLFDLWIEGKGFKREDLGVPDLTLNENDYNEFIYKNFLYDEKNRPNEEVLTFYDNKYPIVKPYGIFNALKDYYTDLIILKREEAARKQGYDLGLKNADEPSLSDSDITGKRDEIIVNEDVFDDDEADIKQIDGALAQVRNKILQGSKSGKRK